MKPGWIKNYFCAIKFFSALTFLFFAYTADAQYKNVRVDRPGTRDAEEVSISINPVKPEFLAAGANLNYFFSSSNNGLVWTQSSMQSAFGVWGDPCLLYDGLSNLYFVHLSYPPPAVGSWIDRIVVQKSTDNGLTWNSGIGVGLNPPKQQDKAWLGVDLSSQKYKNNLYLAWTQFDKYGSNSPQDSSVILFSRSTDQGINWSSPVRVSDRAGDCLDSDSTDEGAVPCVGPNGEVYLSWAGPLGIMFDKSTDGGVTFGKDIYVTDQPGGWDFNVAGIFRCNGLPVTACDTSHSVYRGNIYILWSDQRNGETNTDVFLIKSTDGGNTWGKTVKVNNDNSDTQQFFPWMAIDQTTGFIYVVFYDRRNTMNAATDVYLARSSDGGDSFQNFKISDSSFTPDASIFFGDYTNIAAYKGRIYPIWMRMDVGSLSIWTAPLSDSDLVTSVSGLNPSVNNFELMQNYPNPFNPATKLSFVIGHSSFVSLKVYDVLGREIETIVNEEKPTGIYRVDFDGSKLASGIYFYRIEAGEFIQTRKMLLIK